MAVIAPEEVLLTVGDSAVDLKVSPDSVRRYEEIGILPAAFKTRNGLRLFRASDVERLRQQRAATQASASEPLGRRKAAARQRKER